MKPALSDWNGTAALVVLAHEPDTADRIAQSGISALQLSATPMAARFGIPGFSPMALRLPSWGKKYTHGHYQLGKLQLYVNRGIGCVGQPVRFACPPEVTEITLRAPVVLA